MLRNRWPTSSGISGRNQSEWVAGFDRNRRPESSGIRRKSITVPIGNVPGNLSKAMQEKVDSERGRRIYPQRVAIVEPVFANIRVNKRADRFTLRGKIKVNIQWLLYCMVHNMEKILNYGLTHVPT